VGFRNKTSWWFQPRIGNFPEFSGENNTNLKPPPRIIHHPKLFKLNHHNLVKSHRLGPFLPHHLEKLNPRLASIHPISEELGPPDSWRPGFRRNARPTWLVGIFVTWKGRKKKPEKQRKNRKRTNGIREIQDYVKKEWIVWTKHQFSGDICDFFKGEWCIWSHCHISPVSCPSKIPRTHITMLKNRMFGRFRQVSMSLSPIFVYGNFEKTHWSTQQLLAKLNHISPTQISLKLSGISLTIRHHLGAQNSCEVAS